MKKSTLTSCKQCKYPSSNEESRSSAFASIEHNILYKCIDVPKWYMCPISPMYSTDDESEYCKGSVKELTTWCVKENEGFNAKINNLIKNKRYTPIGKGGNGEVRAYYLDNAKVAVKLCGNTWKEEAKILQHLSTACNGSVPNYLGHGIFRSKNHNPKQLFWICMDFIDSEEIDKLKYNFELEKFVSVFVKTLRAL